MTRPKTIALPGDLTLRCDKIIGVRPEMGMRGGRHHSTLKVSDGSSTLWTVECGTETKGRQVYQTLVDIMEAYAPAEPAETTPAVESPAALFAVLNQALTDDVRETFGELGDGDLAFLRAVCDEDPPEYYPAAELAGGEPRLKLFLAMDLVRKVGVSVYTLVVAGPALYRVPGATELLQAPAGR